MDENINITEGIPSDPEGSKLKPRTNAEDASVTPEDKPNTSEPPRATQNPWPDVSSVTPIPVSGTPAISEKQSDSRLFDATSFDATSFDATSPDITSAHIPAASLLDPPPASPPPALSLFDSPIVSDKATPLSPVPDFEMQPAPDPRTRITSLGENDSLFVSEVKPSIPAEPKPSLDSTVDFPVLTSTTTGASTSQRSTGSLDDTQPRKYAKPFEAIRSAADERFFENATTSPKKSEIPTDAVVAESIWTETTQASIAQPSPSPAEGVQAEATPIEAISPSVSQTDIAQSETTPVASPVATTPATPEVLAAPAVPPTPAAPAVPAVAAAPPIIETSATPAAPPIAEAPVAPEVPTVTAAPFITAVTEVSTTLPTTTIPAFPAVPEAPAVAAPIGTTSAQATPADADSRVPSPVPSAIEQEATAAVEEATARNLAVAASGQLAQAPEVITADYVSEEPIETEAEPMEKGISVITREATVLGDIITEGHIDIVGRIKGNIDAKGDVAIHGIVRGDVGGSKIGLYSCRVKGNLDAGLGVIVDDNSIIGGDVRTKNIIFDGKVKGNIDADNVVVLRSHSYCLGDVSAASLAVEPGAILNGKVRTFVEGDLEAPFDEVL